MATAVAVGSGTSHSLVAMNTPTEFAQKNAFKKKEQWKIMTIKQ